MTIVTDTIAIVGASRDRKKYGNKAVRAFRDGGWTVFPINPREEEIEGLKCYPSVVHCPDSIRRVSMYVPPDVGKPMLEAIASKQPKEFYLNPGSEDEELIARAKELGLEPTVACSIVNIGMRPDMYPDA